MVVGIDPGDLSVPHVTYTAAEGMPAARDGTIVHVRDRVENCDALLSALKPVRICTIDMNCERSASLAFVRTMAPYMGIGSLLVSKSGSGKTTVPRPGSLRADKQTRTQTTTQVPGCH